MTSERNMSLSEDSGVDIDSPYVDVDDLRNIFAMALSDMYRAEVPLYGDLVRIVKAGNNETLATSSDPKIVSMRNGDVASERLDIERHGAIRLGTPAELRTVRRIFAAIGMHPVGYYDLSIAGLPMHATCFRPTTTDALRKNPFRVFTTLLRPELVGNDQARELAADLLTRRHIFSERLLSLLDTAEKQGGRLTHAQASPFVYESLKTFSWRPVAAATHAEYLKLKTAHTILADISCFQSAHINHLTPRTLAISAVPERLANEGLAVKNRIEGPPERACPILLRQTSFLALEEKIKFPEGQGDLIEGTHKARFGEIEERGTAVTAKGRKLYDSLLEEASSIFSRFDGPKTPKKFDEVLFETFRKYPDTWIELRQRGLIYCTYRCVRESPVVGKLGDSVALEDLILQGVVEAVPITYEDFLPFSAAGIFQSNLQDSQSAREVRVDHWSEDQGGLESALGCRVIDADQLYSSQQQESLRICAAKLGLPETTFFLVD